MNTVRVTKNNSTFQQILALKQNRKKRNEMKLMFVEGVRNINLAVKYNWEIESFIYDDYSQLSNWAKDKINFVHTKVNYSISSNLIKELSGKTDVSELMALVKIRKNEIKVKNNPFIILFDRPSKKGNLGSMIRSADAFGADGIIVTGHSVDLYDPDVISSSMGSFFALNVERLDTNQQIINKFNSLKNLFPDLQICATTETGDDNIRTFDFTKPTILMIGNENLGLNRFLLDEIATNQIKIPMVGEASSFNASCAATVFMYELFIQRRYEID